MKRNYYFLATSLPKLEIGVPPDIDFQELQRLLRENLSEADYRKVIDLRTLFDIRNLHALWAGETLDYWGNLDANELEEEILTQEHGVFPPYVVAYLNEYQSVEERRQHYGELMIRYFKDMAAHQTGFLKWYMQFERNLRLVLLGFRARQLNRSLTAELQFEDPEEDIIAQLLAQKDAKAYEPPIGFEDLKPILERYYRSSPLELQKALSEYRFNKIEEGLTFDEFSIDRILGYIVQYVMVDQWLHYDQQKGLELINRIEQQT